MAYKVTVAYCRTCGRTAIGHYDVMRLVEDCQSRRHDPRTKKLYGSQLGHRVVATDGTFFYLVPPTSARTIGWEIVDHCPFPIKR